VTPALLALRVWVASGVYASVSLLRRVVAHRDSPLVRDRLLRRAARKLRDPVIIWDDGAPEPAPQTTPAGPALRAAE
ncbi:MAG: hypothetical protein D6811_10870, partial [Alphaproteobacteria bacterium]